MNKAAKVMEIMIENFAIASMFGSDNLQYFADVTCSGIIVTERFTYHYKYPSQQNIQSMLTLHPFCGNLLTFLQWSVKFVSAMNKVMWV